MVVPPHHAHSHTTSSGSFCCWGSSRKSLPRTAPPPSQPYFRCRCFQLVWLWCGVGMVGMVVTRTMMEASEFSRIDGEVRQQHLFPNEEAEPAIIHREKTIARNEALPAPPIEDEDEDEDDETPQNNNEDASVDEDDDASYEEEEEPYTQPGKGKEEEEAEIGQESGRDSHGKEGKDQRGTEGDREGKTPITNEEHKEALPSGESPAGKEKHQSSEEKAAPKNIPHQPLPDEKEKPSSDDLYFRDPNATVADWDYFPTNLTEPRRDPSWAKAGTVKPLSKEQCSRLLNTIDTSRPAWREPTHKACEGYDGVLHIRHWDEGGASGTVFFLFTIAMMAWADQHNFLPWVHVNTNVTEPIWDPLVHTNVTTVRNFTMMKGIEIGWARDKRDPRWNLFPGKPFQRRRRTFERTYEIRETGVWEHYFLPPTDFVPGDQSCRSKPLVWMDEDHLVPGIHTNAPWAPRAWRIGESKLVLRDDLSYDQWFRPQRQRGAELVKRWIRFQPYIEQRASCAFPDPAVSLGMHIRHGDKYIERDVIPVQRFLKYARAFVEHGGKSIYVATDSSRVLEAIYTRWPKHVAERVVHQPVIGLTANETAAFDVGVSRHTTNTEALTDILALSKSTFFLHGLSAMSEVVLYLNPGLVRRAINLEDDFHRENYTPDFFVQHVMPLGKPPP